jgi:hypothetical protein
MFLYDCDVHTTTSDVRNETETVLEQYLTDTLRHVWSCNVTFKSYLGKVFKYKATRNTTILDALKGAADENETGLYMLKHFRFVILKNKNIGQQIVDDASAATIKELVNGYEDDIHIAYAIRMPKGG